MAPNKIKNGEKSIPSKSGERVASVIEIDPEGDILLEVSGPDGMEQLHVSSKVLSLASVVFAKMLRSGFHEGLRQRQNTGNHRIPLPEDDGKALLVICNAIHHRVDEVPKLLAVETLVNVGMLADKYDLTRTLLPWSSMWLQRKIHSTTGQDLHRLLSAAYNLDNPDMFSKISWKVICSHVGPFQSIPGMGDYVTYSHMLAEFEARKTTIALGVLEAVESSITDIIQFGSCSGTQSAAWCCLKELQRCGLWPMTKALGETSINSALDRILSCQDVSFQRCNGSGYCRCQQRRWNLSQQFRKKKEIIVSEDTGVCLDCVKTKRESLERKDCRIKHV